MGSDVQTERIAKMFADIGRETGVEVRLAPRGEDETAFCVALSGQTVTAYVNGTGEAAERTAKLVAYFLANADPRTAGDRDGCLKGVLLGEGGEWDAFRFLTRYSVRDSACVAFDIVPDKRLKEACELVRECLEGTRDLAVPMDGTRIAVVRFSDEEQSAFEFGQFLWQSLYEELGVRASIGIGCEAPSFSDVSLSYGQAATAVRMGAMFEAAGEVHSYREYLLVKMLEDIPAGRLKEYSAQFSVRDIGEVFGDDEMAATAEAFLECSLNISETSRRLYVHRNTLLYRLDKIERVTGLNLRKFSDAVTFRVLAVLYRLADQ